MIQTLLSNRRLHGGVWSVWRAVSLLLFGTVLFALLSFYPMEGAYRLPSGSVAQGWLCKGVRITFPVIFAVLSCTSLWIWRRTGDLLSGVKPRGSTFSGVVQALRPFSALPFLAAFRHTAGWFGVSLAAMALPVGIPLLFALVSERLSRPMFEEAEKASLRPLPRLIPFAAAFVALLVLHVWPAGNRFRGGGDVCHYEIQTRNLVEKGSLDLTERLEGWMDQERISPKQEAKYLFTSHMRRNVNGRIFSVHAYGWPLLAWPFAKMAGEWGESLFCILVGALALTGVFASCRRCGASEGASRWATAMLGLSWFWVYTSLSRLPEMLGCMLCIWGFWAALAQREPGKEIKATLVSAVCCSYLPFAHMRFIAIAVVLVLAFFAMGAIPRRRAGDRFRGIRLLLYTALIALAWSVLWVVHRNMFAGISSFRMSQIFFSHPISMLGIYVDRRGACGIYPAIWLVGLAPALFLFRGPPLRRGAAALALALEATTLVACCANSGTLIGSCVSARYFLQAIPPLVPFGALWLDRTGRPGRRWWFFLSWMPVLYLFAISPWCSGGGLVHSPYGLWEFDAFRSYWQPLRMMFSPLSTLQAAICLVLPTMLVSASFAVSPHTMSRSARTIFWLLIAIGTMAGLASDRFLPRAGETPATAFGNSHHWHEFRKIAGDPSESFFQAFRPGSDQVDPEAPALVISDGADSRVARPHDKIVQTGPVSKPDWAGRNRHWIPVRTFKPRSPRRGAVVIRLRGHVHRGNALLSVTTRVLSFFPEGVSLEEGPFDVALLISTNGAKTTVMAALEDGLGALRVESLDILPWAPGLDHGIGAFPTTTTVAAVPRLAGKGPDCSWEPDRQKAIEPHNGR